MHKIETLDALESLYGAPAPAALAKVADHLSPLYAKWINASRFCILSTVGPEGVHGSPRGDAGPVVRILDDRTLLMPDWRGNNRLDCLRDIAVDGRVALLFLVPGSKTTVRVNGRAYLTDDLVLREGFAHKGRLPTTVIVTDVHEAYTQCAKAIMRSGLWERDDAAGLPTMGEIIAEASKGAMGGPDFDATYEERAQDRMW